MKLHPFLFMGCWNKEGGPRNAVAEAVAADTIPRLILGGDNVYPRSKADKRHTVEAFDAGMALLAGKVLFSALGNHNVVDSNVLERQKATFGIDTPYFVREFEDCDVVVLDTNQMEAYEPMLAWLIDTIARLKADKRPYYLIQHEPFASYKKGKRTVLVNGAPFLRALVAHPPLAVLCADTHNFQAGFLHIGRTYIPQLIVGSGGAEHDPILTDTETPIAIDEDIRYEFYKHVPGYGYMRVTHPAKFQFVPVLDWPAAGGTRYTRRAARRSKNRTRTNRK